MRARLLAQASLGALALLVTAGAAGAADTGTIKVGVLHSLSGTMAISETTLKDAMLMLVDEQNAKGGLLGRKLEPVVVDPASNWPLFAEKARELIAKNEVAATFGCWTSVSRKSVLPVFEELNGLLFYPVQYEGEESSRNVFYTGAAPNQQAIPAVEYLMGEGGEATRFVLLGTDYVYPRTTNKILRAFLHSKGVADADIMEEYTPFGHSDWQTIVAKVKASPARARRPRSCRPSTATRTCRSTRSSQPGHQGRGRARRRLLGRRGGALRHRHLEPGRPPRRLELLHVDGRAREHGVHREVAQVHQERQARHQRPDGGALHRLQDVGAGGRAGRDHRRRRGPPGHVRPEGEEPDRRHRGHAPNHHLTKPVLIGEIQPDGQFETVWQTEAEVPGDAWSDFIPESAKLTADWTYPWVCGGCEKPRF
jgi:urea transport system substrate-binding protein